MLNRSGFEMRLNKRIAAPRGDQAPGFSMLLIDPRQIPSNHGRRRRAAGDDILRAVANRLASNIKSREMRLARLSSGHLAIMLDQMEHPSTLLRIGGQSSTNCDSPTLPKNAIIELTASLG